MAQPRDLSFHFLSQDSHPLPLPTPPVHIPPPTEATRKAETRLDVLSTSITEALTSLSEEIHSVSFLNHSGVIWSWLFCVCLAFALGSALSHTLMSTLKESEVTYVQGSILTAPLRIGLLSTF